MKVLVTGGTGVLGREVVDRPGRFVLLTDDTRVGAFRGATLRDGEPVGRRISAISFDFPSTPTNNFLNLSGDFAIAGRLAGSYTTFPQQPTNPYRHKFHPDHDNLDPTFTSFRAEAFEVNRAFELEFTE